MIKVILSVVCGLVAACIPLYAFYSLWAWCMTQVPIANEWAGLIKIGVTFALIIVGGSTTVAIAFLAGIFLTGFLLAIFK